MSKLTASLFASIFPAATDPNEWVGALNEVLPKYGINTDRRLAVFLAECGHESMGFTHLVENLNYSADALLRVFPKYFTLAQAHQYARNPKAIASRVYANRLGNGSEDSGDGWTHRGHGLIQLTGKANHQAFARSVGMTLDQAMKYMQTKAGAIESACYFWASNNLNRLADTPGVEDETRRINGGTNGIKDRKDLTEKILAALCRPA